MKKEKESLHRTPKDILDLLKSNKKLLELWRKLTPLSKNEWICWVTIVKTPEKRQERLLRMITELQNGEKRPCCWPGCPHRKPNAKKWFDKKTLKN